MKLIEFIDTKGAIQNRRGDKMTGGIIPGKRMRAAITDRRRGPGDRGMRVLL